jgi:hypothetical protein
MSDRQSHVDHLRLCALWYGYGRADGGTKIDAAEFASHYAALAARFENGGTYLPSIQDAYASFIRSKLEQKEATS